MMRLSVLLGILLALSSGPVWAGYDEGVAAYKEADYATALREFRLLAEKGVVVAYTNLGYMYALGEGVAPDMAEAARWFHKAAEAGSVAAQLTLGVLHFNGEGVSRNYPLAYAWFSVAATQGRDDALQYMDIVLEKMSPEEREEAHRYAKDLVHQYSGAGAPAIGSY